MKVSIGPRKKTPRGHYVDGDDCVGPFGALALGLEAALKPLDQAYCKKKIRTSKMIIIPM